MAQDRFFIVPMDQGLQLNTKPWQILDQAFAKLENVYPFRGRIRKRWGSQYMGSLGQRSSRVRINVGTTAAITGNFGPTVVGPAGTVYAKGQMFSVGSTLFTVIDDTPGPQTTLSTGTATATFDVATGTLTITGNNTNPSTSIFFYPATPIMGIGQYYNGTQNTWPSYAFDLQFAYTWNGTAWVRSGSGTSPMWFGTDTNFFSISNWIGRTLGDTAMFVTNFNYTVTTYDPIWYTVDGSTWTSVTGVNGWYTAPSGGAPQTGPFIATAKFIIPYKGRLVLLYPVINDGSAAPGVNTALKATAQWTFIGTPFAVNSWYIPNQTDSAGNIAQGAGFATAATEEEIVSYGFIKDRLIVFFSLSVWELAFTGSQQDPFVWQKLNTELGSESKNSSVPFDREILTVGSTGIHACNGSNVQRIDQMIPDTIFDIKDRNNSPLRVCGIRDYSTECVYWAYPSAYQQDDTFVYPNRILLYNYRNPGWAILIDSVTAFGYWQQSNNTTWADLSGLTWEDWNTSWGSGRDQAAYRQIIAGNQEGFILVVRPDINRNAGVLQISDITNTNGTLELTVYNHNLEVDDYILIESAQGMTGINLNIYKVWRIADKDTLFIYEATAAGNYTGGGTIARVSNIGIDTKQWNPYDKTGRNVYISKIDFGVTNSLSGQVTVDSFPSTSELSTLNNAIPGTLLASGVLETGPYPIQYAPLEQFQELLWHPIYLQIEGENIQVRMYMSDAQMRNPNISLSDFELQGMILFCQPTTNRLQ